MKYRANVLRIYPTADQTARLSSWVGAVRFFYNLALEQRQTFWKPGRQFNYVTQGREIKNVRQEADWLADLPSDALHFALKDLDRAYRAWWRGDARAPSYRQRGRNDSLRVKGVSCRVRKTGRASGQIVLPKIGPVRFRGGDQDFPEITTVTIRRIGGKWYALAATREVDPAEVAPRPEAPVGIDRGVNVFAALSTGELISGPNVGRRAAASLARAQRSLARKTKGSNNRRKARLRVARLHKRVADARKDFLHKASTTIAKNHGVVVLEDLKVRNMTASATGTPEAPGRNVRQKAGLNRAILDQGWGMFRTLLAYKLEERGGHLLTVNPRDTSRTCSACGVVDADSREGVRFSCRSCGHEAHADTNAAINILRRGTPSMPVEAASAADEAGSPQFGEPGNRRMPITFRGGFNPEQPEHLRKGEE